MNKIVVLLTLLIITISCNISENKAIEICKKAKTGNLINPEETWLDFSNNISNEETNENYIWDAEETKADDIFLVSLMRQNDKWGYHFEVNIKENIVKDVNSSPYLSRKYGFDRINKNTINIFQITSKIIDTLRNITPYSKYNENGICYIFKGVVKNNTGKTITKASISSEIELIFKEKSIIGKTKFWENGFHVPISENNPWINGTERSFYLKTDGIEPIYLNYKPEYIFYNIGIKAEDPIGYSFDADILEYDLKEKWKLLTNKN
jgi:hypothetical protein